MKLSKYFDLEELTASQAAARRGLINMPQGEEMISLTQTATRMDVVRELLGKPVLVSSGYRSPVVNSLVGGSGTSSHVTGEAVDFTCPEFGTPEQIVKHLKGTPLRFDQLIEEFGQWVHIGFGKKLRHQVLKAKHVGGKTVYEDIQ